MSSSDSCCFLISFFSFWNILGEVISADLKHCQDISRFESFFFFSLLGTRGLLSIQNSCLSSALGNFLLLLPFIVYSSHDLLWWLYSINPNYLMLLPLRGTVNVLWPLLGSGWICERSCW